MVSLWGCSEEGAANHCSESESLPLQLGYFCTCPILVSEKKAAQKQNQMTRLAANLEESGGLGEGRPGSGRVNYARVGWVG